ncbi:unnamed protein product [Owenia fusiformis]|uniref:Uncharacterized protein n=1 Tax=Owenia fusiformis TaxID=6347 RepID=A0A8J1TDS5_OWEFU|nr:unnamed protein product [Owenia fusiformis]
MGQHMAKRKVEEGIKLYAAQNHDKAIEKWEQALRKIRGPHDRFAILGYLASAHFDRGKYREMLTFAIEQIDLANETENDVLKAEAYLNLARGNNHLCEYQKAISYSVHCLENETNDGRIQAYAYLNLANAQSGFGNFSKALKYYHEAMTRSKAVKDSTLQLQIYSAMGRLYTALKDYETSLNHFLKAAELSKSSNSEDVNSKYQRETCLNFARPYQKLGRYEEAMEACEEGLKKALSCHDRATQAECLCSFADIHRHRGDFERCYPRYEAALSLMMEVGNKEGQAVCLLGMAKALVASKNITKALEINARAVDIAEGIGNKLQILRCRMHMEELYRTLGDLELVAEQLSICNDLLEDMGLFCGVCNQVMGDNPDKLGFLPCFHLFHSRCMVHILTDGSSGGSLDSGGKWPSCPTCASLPTDLPISPTAHIPKLTLVKNPKFTKTGGQMANHVHGNHAAHHNPSDHQHIIKLDHSPCGNHVNIFHRQDDNDASERRRRTEQHMSLYDNDADNQDINYL